jgi:hypothetical protein
MRMHLTLWMREGGNGYGDALYLDLEFLQNGKSSRENRGCP